MSASIFTLDAGTGAPKISSARWVVGLISSGAHALRSRLREARSGPEGTHPTSNFSKTEMKSNTPRQATRGVLAQGRRGACRLKA